MVITFSTAGTCYWDGTGPFCKGKCPEGYTECGRDNNGDGDNDDGDNDDDDDNDNNDDDGDDGGIGDDDANGDDDGNDDDDDDDNDDDGDDDGVDLSPVWNMQSWLRPHHIEIGTKLHTVLLIRQSHSLFLIYCLPHPPSPCGVWMGAYICQS